MASQSTDIPTVSQSSKLTTALDKLRLAAGKGVYSEEDWAAFSDYHERCGRCPSRRGESFYEYCPRKWIHQAGTAGTLPPSSPPVNNMPSKHIHTSTVSQSSRLTTALDKLRLAAGKGVYSEEDWAALGDFLNAVDAAPVEEAKRLLDIAQEVGFMKFTPGETCPVPDDPCDSD
ncbi:hypothetical protein HK104_011475 [Borealophlyctis nickersoniae]|nr:hypothetical protein HK104_011475 [Borealophlyctis nickersoniae]